MLALKNNNVAAPEWFPDSKHLRVSREYACPYVAIFNPC